MIETGTPYKHTNSTIEPPRDLINFVDVNTVSKSKTNDKRTNTETQNDCAEICTDCIVHEAKVLGLKIRNDQIRKQYYELEKENEMLKSQLNVQIPTTVESNDEIPTECNENCKICFATLTQHEFSTHICIDLDEITCEYCSESFKSINDLWNHLIDSVIHNNMTLHQCNRCTENFPAAVLLKCHENVEHPNLSSKCN